jgi:hypothetical protein
MYLTQIDSEAEEEDFREQEVHCDPAILLDTDLP